jgi:hypothetical protein
MSGVPGCIAGQNTSLQATLQKSDFPERAEAVSAY